MTLGPLAALGLEHPAIAVAFLDAPPAGLPREESPALSGCTFWKRAAEEQRAFYTLAEDHLGCPIGAHTHNAQVPDERKAELQEMVGTMLDLEYLREQEVGEIPRRSAPLDAVAYSPLADASFTPDVVLVRGDTRQLMLLYEATQAAGVGGDTLAMGRPTCAMIPHTLNSGRATFSFGCIGNRVYTGLGDGEMYAALPGGSVDAVLERLTTVLNANAALETFHRSR